jgi:TRAP-type C4-dicarboxylate transport system substrate-binding protein
MYEQFAAFLAEESGGSMTATILGPEVGALPQMNDALQTGLANIGNALLLCFAANFPETGIAGDLALLGRNLYAMGFAMTDFGVHCAPWQAEFKEFDSVFLGAGSSDVYVLLAITPVHNAADLQGLRLRSGGAPYSRWAAHSGATLVNMPVGQTFEAMSQGAIDGSTGSIVDMLSFRLLDVASYVTLVPRLARIT